MRHAASVRLIAAISSRVEARPMLASIFGEMQHRRFGLDGCLALFDAAPALVGHVLGHLGGTEALVAALSDDRWQGTPDGVGGGCKCCVNKCF